MNKIALMAESMPRRPCTFKKSDITRATKAVEAAGYGIARVEVSRDGMIAIVPRQGGAGCSPVQNDEPPNGKAGAAGDLDRELAEFNARHDKD
jgi:hypothetical protein